MLALITHAELKACFSFWQLKLGKKNCELCELILWFLSIHDCKIRKLRFQVQEGWGADGCMCMLQLIVVILLCVMLIQLISLLTDVKFLNNRISEQKLLINDTSFL